MSSTQIELSSVNELNGHSFSVVDYMVEPPSLFEELCGSIKSKFSSRASTKSSSQYIVSAFEGIFPILRWGRYYDLVSFRRDLLAGLTIASLGIPQSIGYANLAKLNPQYGLYTSVVPPLIYAVMGSSKDLAIGPVAAVSLLLSSMLQKVVDPSLDPATYTKLAFTATFFAGVFQAAFGFLRLGFLVDYLSHAAIVGFMGGAAVVIGLQQLKGLFGISKFTNNTDVISVAKALIWSAFHETWHLENFLLGCSFLIFILITRMIGKKKKKLFWLPAVSPLISVVMSTLFVFLTKADRHGVKTIHYVKGGLNPSSVKQLQFTGPFLGESVKIGLVCAIIALAEAIAAGRSFASVRGYKLDGNKEMVAMGCMNIAGSITSCYVATGSFSRSAVNFSAGCKTSISNIVMAITVVVSLELLTRLLYYTPYSILASIIISALPNLINVSEARHILKIDKMDFLACVGAFFGVLFGSVEIGLLSAVIISFARLMLNVIVPRIEILGRVPGTDIFFDIKRYRMLTGTEGILVTRLGSPFLCFTNANFIKERITKWLVIEEESKEGKNSRRLEALVIDMSNLMNIDTSGIIMLEEIKKHLTTAGVQLAIVNPGCEVIQKMKISKLAESIGKHWIFMTVNEAIEACQGFIKDNSYAC